MASTPATVDFAFPGDLECLFELLPSFHQAALSTHLQAWLNRVRQARHAAGTAHPRHSTSLHAALTQVTPWDVLSVPALQGLKPLCPYVPKLLQRCLHEMAGEAWLAAQRDGATDPTILDALNQQLAEPRA